MLDPFLPLTELLLQRGADVNAQTHTGATPLLLSAQAFEIRLAVLCSVYCTILTWLQYVGQSARRRDH